MLFTTYVKINTSLPSLVKKLGTWINPECPQIVAITSYAETKEDSALRAMRLFNDLGCLLLVLDHTTVKNEGNFECVMLRLGIMSYKS